MIGPDIGMLIQRTVSSAQLILIMMKVKKNASNVLQASHFGMGQSVWVAQPMNSTIQQPKDVFLVHLD